MKKAIITGILLLTGMISFVFTKAQTSTEAVEYLEDITLPFAELKDETWQYLKVVTRGKGAKKVDRKRQALIDEIKIARGDLRRKKSFYGDEDLKNTIFQYLDLNYKVFNEDYAKIVDLEEIAEQSYDLMEAYLLTKEKANEKLHAAFDVFKSAERSFADKYNIRLLEPEEDKMSQKIKQANALLKYYNEVYLIFFKVYKQEAYVLDALDKGDVSGVEQNTSALGAFVSEANEKLTSMDDYEGDGSLKLAAKEVMVFYQTEAEKDFPSLVDFYLKKDNFEKMKKIIDSKPAKNRTQEDVDKYNAAVKEYNEAVNTFNQTNTSNNEKRSKFLDKWNKEADSFFERHSI